MSGTLTGPILLVGGGKMGAALAKGWRGAGLAASDLVVVEPDAAIGAELAAALHCPVAVDAAGVAADFAPTAIVLAVKPQVMDVVAPLYRDRVGAGTLVLSIAAGKTLEGLARLLGPGAALVRAMPNTPAAVGRGASVLVAGSGVQDAQRQLAGALMAAVGLVEWVDDEELMHAVTAMSGGGPAYVFLLIEALAQAGVANGLEAGLAQRLARATVIGSGELARTNLKAAAQLRQDVTSPGGTTAQALAVLMAADGLQPLMDRAIAAGAQRSRELA